MPRMMSCPPLTPLVQRRIRFPPNAHQPGAKYTIVARASNRQGLGARSAPFPFTALPR